MKKIFLITSCILLFAFYCLPQGKGWWWKNADDLQDTLGVELLNNGDMELNSIWTAFATEAGDSVNQSTTFAYSPSHSWRLQTNTAEGITGNDFNLTNGGIYYLVFWVKAQFVDQYRVRIQNYYGIEGGTYTSGYITDSDWHKIILKRIATGTGNGKVWLFQHDGTKTNIYIDNVSLKQKIN